MNRRCQCRSGLPDPRGGDARLGLGERARRRPAFALLLSLLLAAPAVALAEDAPKSDGVIYPRSAAPAAATAAAPAGERGGLGSSLLVLGLASAAGGAWLFLRRRGATPGGADRRLAIAETRALGNRQYLVVADYDGRKFLLGVCPGRIEMLTPLAEADTPPSS